MSAQQTGVVNLPFQQFFENLRDFTYDATTYWGRFWNPQFFFGCNIEDVDVEHQVLNKVGSYGSQLSTILDMMDVLVARLPKDARDTLTHHEWAIIEQFGRLVRESKAAVAEQRGERYPGLTQSDVNHLVEGLFLLARYRPGAVVPLQRQLEDALSLLKQEQ